MLEGIRIYGHLATVLSRVNVEQGKTIMSVFFPDVLAERIRPFLAEYPFLVNVIEQVGSWIASTLATLSRSFLGDTIRILYQLIVIVVASFFMIRDAISFLTMSMISFPSL